MVTKTITRIQGQKYANNPRQITRKQFERLKADLAELGDLSGVVHDLNSNQFIGGNQRSEAFSINDCEIELVEQYAQPDKQGTVAHGFIVWQDGRYAYRQVRWTEQQCRAANIKANIDGGSWDADIIASWPVDELQEYGWDADTLKEWNSDAAALNTFIESNKPPSDHTIARDGRLYYNGKHQIEPFKLAHRVEAAWMSEGGRCVEFYAGEGWLTAWYKRRFAECITNDKNIEGCDYQLDALAFVENVVNNFDYDFVDFDDEGSPLPVIKKFFALLDTHNSFYLALTDGSGLNLKLRGIYSPLLYGLEGQNRQATAGDYEELDSLVSNAIKVYCGNKYNARNISSYRGREGNVLYQTWFINCVESPSADCYNQPEEMAEGLS